MSLKNDKKLKLIDLFAGAGGLSLGASRAGFDVVAAVENDPQALDTHRKNFPSTIHLDIDALSLTGSDLLHRSGLAAGELDGLIGGPPCQGFSHIGKGEINDSRNNLFTHFFKLVQQSKPKFFLAENVPGILSSKYDKLRAKAFSHIPKNYKFLSPIKIAANNFGVPTTRTRIFFIGYDPDYIKDLTFDEFSSDQNIPSVFVGDALKGLPRKINPEWQTENQGWRKLGKIPQTPFFENITGNIPDGVGHEGSLEKHTKGKVSGCLGTRHTKKVSDRYAKVKQGRMDSVSKSTKLDPKGFCPTLRAGTARDKGSYQAVRPLHPTQNRVITPREAARLQGFPDWFVFHKTKWHSFRQIGNSVSPIVAEILLNFVREKIKNNSIQENIFLIKTLEKHMVGNPPSPNVATLQP